MNTVIENIFTRRSVRDFSDNLVEKDDMETLIQAALYAPSGMNKQTWKFIGILNQDLIKELAEIVGRLLNRDEYKFYNATALIITTNEMDSKWGIDDNACALQNIFLAGHSLNIGSVWINQFRDICDEKELREILTKMGVPANHTVHGVAALGYSLSEAKGKVEKAGDYVIIE